MSNDFLHDLTERIRSGMGPAVVGLDPRPDALPAAVEPEAPAATRIAAFYRQALPVLARHVPAVKPNIAFFECHGAAGLQAYVDTCATAREHGLVVIGDIKRGDIGSTAEAYADFHLRVADAVTLQPYLGRDSHEPFLRLCREQGRGVFVLVRTSNQSAAELQDLHLAAGDAGERVCDAVARSVDRIGEALPRVAGYSPVGAVVGATSKKDVEALRKLMPRAWLLLPGVGAQGATADDCAAAFDDDGLGGLISQSRGVMQGFDPADAGWLEAIETAVAAFSQQAREVARDAARSKAP